MSTDDRYVGHDGERWLWITPEIRDDLSTGALMYSMQLARAVARADVQVTLVGIGPSVAAYDGITAITIDDGLRGGIRSLLSPWPNLAYACATPMVSVRVAALLEQRWDAVVIDGLQAAWATDLVAEQHDGPTVFVAHNHEGSLRWNVAREMPWASPRRWALAVDAWKAARLERRSVSKAHVVTSITEADREKFAREDSSSTHVVITPGWTASASEAGERTPIGQRPRRVAILGSFDWHVKQENLRRFVAVADPVFARHDIELVIGGRIPDEVRIEIVAGTEATRFEGWIADAEAFLDSSRMGVVSEPLGGGFKLKTLDYIFNRLPLATTLGGASGLDLVAGDTMIEAADEASLAAAIVEVVDDADRLEAIASKALEQCAFAFSWDGRGRLLVEAVGEQLRHSSRRSR